MGTIIYSKHKEKNQSLFIENFRNQDIFRISNFYLYNINFIKKIVD